MYRRFLTRVEGLVFTRDRTSYAILSTDSADATHELARRSFHFL